MGAFLGAFRRVVASMSPKRVGALCDVVADKEHRIWTSPLLIVAGHFSQRKGGVITP